MTESKFLALSDRVCRKDCHFLINRASYLPLCSQVTWGFKTLKAYRQVVGKKSLKLSVLPEVYSKGAHEPISKIFSGGFLLIFELILEAKLRTT